MKQFLLSFSALVFTFVLAACEEDGKPIGAPALEPPVEATKPSGMSSNALTSCPDCETPLETLKGRLFSPGESDFQGRLRMIDERMGELNKRSEESERDCLDKSPVEWNPPSLPGGAAFPMYFFCHEQLSEQSQMAFGKKDDSFYLAELQKAGGQGPAIAVLAKSNLAGNVVEVWQILIDSDEKENGFAIMQIKADEVNNAFEISVGGDSNSIGVSCGIRMKSNQDHIYATGIFANNQSGGGNDGCTETDENFPLATFCASSATLESYDDLENCSSASLDSLSQENHGDGNNYTYAEAEALINAQITGVASF